MGLGRKRGMEGWGEVGVGVLWNEGVGGWGCVGWGGEDLYLSLQGLMNIKEERVRRM